GLLREYHGTLPALLFSLIYPVVYATAGSWMSGQHDYLGAHAITIAAFLLLRRIDGRGFGWVVLSGVLIGMAIVLKPTLGLAGPMLLAYDLYRMRRLRPVIIDTLGLGLGVSLAISPLIALGAFAGALRPCFEMSLVFSKEYYAGGVGFVAATL